jgi:hypothetical protein
MPDDTSPEAGAEQPPSRSAIDMAREAAEPPRPVFQCACPTADAHACLVVRYAQVQIERGERCECACHFAAGDDDEW